MQKEFKGKSENFEIIVQLKGMSFINSETSSCTSRQPYPKISELQESKTKLTLVPFVPGSPGSPVSP